MPTRCVLHAAAFLSLLLLSGCANPLVPLDSDYDTSVSIDRLRTIKASPLTAYKKEQQVTNDASLLPSIEQAKNRFANLERVDLTIEDCRASALQHNLDLKVALLNPAIAAESQAEEEGRFESVFTFRTLWSQTDSPVSSELDSAQQKFLQVEPGVRIPLRTGGTATVTLPFTRNETNNQFSTLNPAYTSDLQFSLSQPLMRGGGRRAATYNIRIAGINRQISQVQAKAEVTRQLAAVDRAYWRLYGVQATLDVRLDQLELAQAQLARAQRQYNAGDAAEIEVIRAQAGVADQLDAIISAQNEVLAGQRELKRIINEPGLDIESTTAITIDSKPDPVAYEFDTQALIDAAIANRTEMLEFELRLASDLATADWSRNAALPLLALDYTYRVNGLGDSVSSTIQTLKRNNFEDWSIGLRGEVPLGNAQREAALRRALLQRISRLASKEARAQAITREVLDAIDQINTTWQRIIAARQSVILNTRSYNAETRQFEAGASTSTDVLNASAALSQARANEVRALVDYQIAQVDLAFATGTLLGADKIEFALPDPLGTVTEHTNKSGWTNPNRSSIYPGLKP